MELKSSEEFHMAKYLRDGNTLYFLIVCLRTFSTQLAMGTCPRPTCFDHSFQLTWNFEKSPRCPQPQEPNTSDFYQSYLEFPADVAESEFDCLNLFITRPSRVTSGSETKLPVYVYIHGGAYAFGAGTDPMWGEKASENPGQRCEVYIANFNLKI